MWSETGRLLWVTCCIFLLLAGCKGEEAIRIGYVGGLSGRFADLGTAGRNAVILAVEERNANGGINGRRVELLIRDDEQKEKIVADAISGLIDSGVSAIIGPMTSSMAMVGVPIANRRNTVLMGATVATNLLNGKDDMFFRTLGSTRSNIGRHVEFLVKRGRPSAAVVYDLRNRAYSEDWATNLSGEYVKAGGKIVHLHGFESGGQAEMAAMADALVSKSPGVIVLVCNSVDAALLAQHIRRLNPKIAIHTAEWAATEGLIEMGGRAVDGITVGQYIDRSGEQPGYLRFNEKYRARYGADPGFASIVAYEAAIIVLESLAQQRAGEHLKQTILRIKNFPGLQRDIVYDDYGDTLGRVFMTQIRNGKFVVLE